MRIIKSGCIKHNEYEKKYLKGNTWEKIFNYKLLI